MAAKHKGFSKQKPEKQQPVPLNKMEQIATTSARLERLLAEILETRLPPQCYGTIKRLAHIAPAYRLLLNMKAVLTLLCARNIENILQDGLTEDERAVLMAIDASGMSIESRRTAHSLFNLIARAAVVRALDGMFRDMRTRRNHVLEDCPLD